MKISNLLGTPSRGFEPPPLKRDRPDDPVRVRLIVDLRDGRTFEIELPKGVRPRVDLTTEHDPGAPGFDYYASRSFRTTEDSVRIVIEADTRDGRAEDDGCLFRFTVREPKEASA
jgi:hypothetical protein